MLNQRRPAGLPPIMMTPNMTTKWKKMGRAAWNVRNQVLQANSSSSSSNSSIDLDTFFQLSRTRHSQHYRECGMQCVRDMKMFASSDLKLLGWKL